MKPVASMTLNEAQEMKAKAIERAKALNIVHMVWYLLKIDATTDGQRYVLAEGESEGQGEEIEPYYKARPLPGSGLMLTGTLRTDDQFIVTVSYAYNTSERVFFYEKERHQVETYHIFREGSWVPVLKGNYDAVKFREENAPLIHISKNFSPVEVPHAPEKDR